MANLLTGLRLVLVVPAGVVFAQWFAAPRWLPIGLVIVAIVTDYVDGIVARRRNTASDAGQLFDHTTDFLFVTTGLAGAAAGGLLPGMLPVLIVVAFSQYVLDSRFLYRQKRLLMSPLGRWNGILYFAPLVMIGLARLQPLGPLADLSASLVEPFSYLLIVSTLLSIGDRALAPARGRRKAEAFVNKVDASRDL